MTNMQRAYWDELLFSVQTAAAVYLFSNQYNTLVTVLAYFVSFLVMTSFYSMIKYGLLSRNDEPKAKLEAQSDTTK